MHINSNIADRTAEPSFDTIAWFVLHVFVKYAKSTSFSGLLLLKGFLRVSLYTHSAHLKKSGLEKPGFSGGDADSRKIQDEFGSAREIEEITKDCKSSTIIGVDPNPN